jgi:hypothetical protein
VHVEVVRERSAEVVKDPSGFVQLGVHDAAAASAIEIVVRESFDSA